MSSPESVQMEEVRRRSQALLSSSGSAQDVKAEVQTMAALPLPLSEKYRHLGVEAMLAENTTCRNSQEVLESLSRLVKALSILEKYGCNLTSPARPRYWRSVKHNNPVFRTTVDAIKGGRTVLFLYGYTSQQSDGLSFPDDVTQPDAGLVAAVTLEVMTLRTEVDMLLKGSHPHPDNFRDIIPFILQQVPVVPLVVQNKPAFAAAVEEEEPAERPALDPGGQPLKPATAGACGLCGAASSLVCSSCDGQTFCDACDDLFHRLPARANHKRATLPEAPPVGVCTICGVGAPLARCGSCSHALCDPCDTLFHAHPDHRGHRRGATTSSPSLSPWACARCTTVNEMRAVLCATCERPRLAAAAPEVAAPVPTSPSAEWRCRSCTVANAGNSILCEVCERPRLATRPHAAALPPPTRPHAAALPPPTRPHAAALPPGPAPPAEPVAKWMCQYCTYVNPSATALCEMCNLSSRDSAGASLPRSLKQTKDKPPPEGPRPPPEGPRGHLEEPQLGPEGHLEAKRQKTMREDGLHLVQQIREAERRGVSAEEVYAAICMCGGSNANPCDWLSSELPHLLDEICAMAASVQVERDGEEAEPSGVKPSRAEAKTAWLAARGDTERAVRQLLRDRQVKMKELRSLGFREAPRCEEALRLSGGEVKGALSLLQRPLLEPFHRRIWADQPEPAIDPKHPDKQRTCRRLLALYDLPSWGRCELVLALLQEPDVTSSLDDVVQAVKESQDKDFIRRLLINECPCCLSNFPRSKMQSLTSCQCSVCHECFGQHFTVAVRDRHIRDMVCPVCGEPDINESEQLDSYFSTLDIQLRNCLEADVYDLFHKKLTEHALMKDPKFLWCCHCTSGFINDGDQLKVTCPSCFGSFCARCKKPWEAQHQDLSCEQFQQWKRENDPDHQRQGLAGFLRDNGITCPSCRFQYALTKGGCMHFSCLQCRYQFCSGCNNPYHKTVCKAAQCSYTGLHAHHPRDCLFYLRDWEPARLQALLQRSGVDFNTDPSDAAQGAVCCVMEQKDEDGQQIDSPCGHRAETGRAGLCEKHYKEYLVSLVNAHSLDPAPLYEAHELIRACERYLVHTQRAAGGEEDDDLYHARLLTKLTEVPLGETVPRNK